LRRKERKGERAKILLYTRKLMALKSSRIFRVSYPASVLSSIGRLPLLDIARMAKLYVWTVRECLKKGNEQITEQLRIK
jgi:hypothetical protein